MPTTESASLVEMLGAAGNTTTQLTNLTTWANAVKTVADTARLLSDQGAPIDAAALATMLGIPLRDVENARLGPLFAYHIQSGCFTVNEVRASTGRPPIADGDQLLPAVGAAPQTTP